MNKSMVIFDYYLHGNSFNIAYLIVSKRYVFSNIYIKR